MSQNNSSSKTKTPRGWGEQREELFVASNYTTNYQLNQWEAGDQVLRTEFNQDNQKIDTALAGLAAQNEELEVAVASKGNCHFYTTSYIGTGQVGANNPCTLSFPAKPIFFFVRQMDAAYWIAEFYGSPDVHVCVPNGAAVFCTVSWSGNVVSWYHASNATSQMNKSGETYQVFAFLETSGEVS